MTAMRQNAGRDFTKAAVCGEFPIPGMVSAPAATDCAEVICACGRAILESASQELAAGGADCANAGKAKHAEIASDTIARVMFTAKSPVRNS